MHTTSRDQVAVVPPIVTPTIVIKYPHSRMEKLEQRIRWMRDLEETIYWDDTDDMPVATLPTDFRMHEIERYISVGCPRIQTLQHNYVGSWS